jgi:bifunctional DNA-binding transcriptional regulator/antitoxin component of YhaV-PrlF toxin-antitoxin module
VKPLSPAWGPTSWKRCKAGCCASAVGSEVEFWDLTNRQDWAVSELNAVPTRLPGAALATEGGGCYRAIMAPATKFLTLDEEGRTTLPREVRDALGVETGGFLLLELTERGTFELVPASLIPSDQLWFHHPEMQERIALAEEELATGRSTRTETLEQAQELLDQLKQKSPSRT